MQSLSKEGGYIFFVKNSKTYRKVDSLSYKTLSVNKETAQKEWLVIDAENEVLGRLASQIAKIIRGKNKPSFTPHSDCGDYVIILNADKVRLTGNKMSDKEYVRYTGYPGGQRITTAKELLVKHPTSLVQKAIKGMLPKNKLSSAIMNNLYIYTGVDHPHVAQKPKEIKLNSIK